VCSTGPGSGALSTRRAAKVPSIKPLPAAMLIGSTAPPRRPDPTTANNPPRNVAPTARVTPRPLTDRAAGTAANSRGNASNPGPTNRSEDHGTAPADRNTPTPTSAAANAGPSPLITATTWPSACNRRTCPANPSPPDNCCTPNT